MDAAFAWGGFSFTAAYNAYDWETPVGSGVVENETMRSDVWMISYGDSAVNYELVVWADRKLTGSPASAHAKLMWALDDQLKARGIEIPFPQRVVHGLTPAAPAPAWSWAPPPR